MRNVNFSNPQSQMMDLSVKNKKTLHASSLRINTLKQKLAEKKAFITFQSIKKINK